MLLRGMKLTIVGTGLLLAVSANAQSPKFGFEYRAGLTYDDGNLNKTKGVDAKTSTDIALEFANITAEGEAAKNVNYAFSYNMLDSNLEIGNVVMKFNDMMSFYAGRGKVAQGGWHHKDHYGEYNNVETDFGFGYSMAAPVKTYADSLGLQLNLAGLLSINAYNDVSTAADTNADGKVDADDSGNGAGSHNSGEKSQLFTVEWMGNFNGWMPLVQLMTYDLNNSMAISAGVKGNVAGLGLLVNYTTDSRSNKAADDKFILSQIDFHASYALSGFTPWLGFHQFAVKQPKTDSKVNSGATAETLDDNAQLISLGVNCTSCGNGYVPYVSLNSQSGKYNKDFTDTTKEETKSGLAIKAGVMGKF